MLNYLSDLHSGMKEHFANNAHLWKRAAILWFLLLQTTSFVTNGTGFSWSYPLKEVSKDSTCRKTDWDELSADCKQPLPIIKWAQYSNYKDNPAYTTIYTTLWWAPYENGWAAGQGAHEWVDIVSSQDTPVYAVEDGVITRARAQAWYGNVVMIKHTLPNKSVVFSIYGHLHKITVAEWATVREWDNIGTVGNEGFSFGNHLLFDINITPTNTYAFWWCPEYGNGSTFNIIETIVDQGLCRSYLLERTTDPIAWIESQWGSIALNNSTPSSTNIAQTTHSSSNRRRMPMVGLAPIMDTSTPTVTQSNTTKTTSTVTQKSLATRIISSADVAKNEVATTKITTLYGANVDVVDMKKLGEDFLTKYNIKVLPWFPNSLDVGDTTSIIISITDKDGKPFVGMLPKEITLIPSVSNITLSPQVIRLTNSDGKALVLISANSAGKTSIVVSYNMKTISKIDLTVQ